MAASANRNMPEAPIGLVDSTPPEQFHGMSPSIDVAPSCTSFQPSPTSQKPRFSSHMASNHENGTYTSAASISRRGSVMPAWAYTSLAQSFPPCGETWSRPAISVGSLRHAVPCTQAGANSPSWASPPASLVITMAHAPSDEGHVSEYRIGSQIIIDSRTDS